MKCNDFIYDNIFPITILKTRGKVTDAENLLIEKELQITTCESNICELTNSITNTNAEIILDFGKELHGAIRILTYTISGSTPAKMQITLGESVAEAISSIGENGSCNDHATRCTEYLFPEFSDVNLNYSGFRYARIKLLSKNTTVRIKSIVALTKMRDIPYLGSFDCNNETINEIYKTAAYTCHLTMQEYIWDGIKRDRLVWVGDMHPEMLTVRTVFGANKIIENSLEFMKNTTPADAWMNGMPTYTLWWIHILYDWYLYTGNKDLLEGHKEYALSIIKRIINLVNEDGSDNFPSYFLDWPCNDKPQSVTGSRALLALVLESCKELSIAYNINELALECTRKKNILISTDINTYGAKQVIAIASLAGWIKQFEAGKMILENGCDGWSTFMSYYLMKAASLFDMSSTLDALETYYGAMLKMGATTFWEDFDINWIKDSTPIDTIPEKHKPNIHADFGKFCYKGLRHSLCHGWSSAPTAFLAEEVLGIKIKTPGCTAIEISPNLGNLEYAKGTYPTIHGIITVHCYKKDGTIIVKYSAPENIKITIKNSVYGGNI